jgi:glycosyltransferase involved in cell wall biosynthesis
MKNILLLSHFAEWHLPSQHRFFQAIPYLKLKKINVLYKSLYNVTYLEEFNKLEKINVNFFGTVNFKRIIQILYSDIYDTLWVDSEAMPGFPFFLESFFLPIDKKVVLDLGDTTFFKYETINKRYYRTFLKDKFPGIIQRADYVISRNSSIKEYADNFIQSKSILIPPTIDLNQYPPYSQLDDIDKNEFVIGFTGNHFSSNFLIKLDDVLRELSRVYPIRLLIINGNKNLNFSIRTTFITAEGEEEIKELSGIDVGIFPSPHSLKEKGNLSIGILKCMALSKPVIASDIGSAKDYITHSVNGYLCKTNDDWYLALRLLLDEKELIESMGLESRKIIEKEYSITNNINKLSTIFLE